MLEFITLSNRPEHHQKLAASIPLAMGDLAPWNLTIVDASQHDMFSGYNHGARQTEGEILVFVHDDAQFLGNPLTMAGPLQTLQDPQTGFIGVAGTRLLDRDACWWGLNSKGAVTEHCLGLIYQTGHGELGIHANPYPEGTAQFGRVVVLDGVLLMCHRRTFERLNGFDEQSYKGFHFYDIDITFRAALAQLQNLVAPIPLLHASPGGAEQAWEANRQIFLRKYGHLLPARLT
jgi:hypothetical protein